VLAIRQYERKIVLLSGKGNWIWDASMGIG